jgi:hypothetical protein
MTMRPLSAPRSGNYPGFNNLCIGAHFCPSQIAESTIDTPYRRS